MKIQVAILAAVIVVISCQRAEPTVLVDSISLSPAELVIREGEQKKVSATVFPENATDNTLTWTSSAPNVATVIDGKVRGVAKGKATISATANDASGIRATCNVSVKSANPEISFDPGQEKDIVFESGSGFLTLSFTALEDWTAAVINTRADSWLEISPTSGGRGKAEIKVTVAENTSFDGRSASIKIAGDEETETVTVTQKQKDAITLSTDRFEVGSEGGTVSLKLKSNVNFSYQIDEDCESWIKVPETKAYNDYTYDFIVLANRDILKREGGIVFTDGNLSETVRIFQEGALPTIVVSQNSYEIGSEGGEIRIDVRSNVDVTMVVPEDTPWLKEVPTKAYSTNTFYLKANPNPEPDDRSATVIFMNNENGLSEKVFIVQKQLDQINIGGNEVTVGEAGGNLDITLESNIEYRVSVDADWIKEIITKGLVSYMHSFSVDPLPDDMFFRTAAISITDAQGTITRTISVVQKDLSPIIEFEDGAVKAICIENWDKSGDRELSRREAAAVQNLGRVFCQNNEIAYFKELAFFTGLTEIPSGAFLECESLQRVAIPGGVTKIGYAAFYDCQALESISLPESLTHIDNLGFGYCQSLKAIILPENLTRLEQYAFYNCSMMKWLECLPTVPPECGADFLTHTPEGWIIVPDESAQRYKATEGWKDYSDRIISRSEVDSPPIEFEDGAVKAICVENWDMNYDGEVSEKEAATVKSLDRVFYHNPDITSFDELAFFTGLTEINDSAFRGCEALQAITIPEGVTRLGDSAFYDCQALESISLPESLIFIDSWAFGNPRSMKSIVIPANVTIIGDHAFYQTNFSRIDIMATETPELGENNFEQNGCLIYVPKGKAVEYQETDGWKTLCSRITEEGHLPKDFFYSSTDYSRDGEVICLQRATKGRGINIIFLGDGFVDRTMAPGGEYETVMCRWMEQFFAYEPYTTFREWFNIYTVKVVSKNYVFGTPDAERRLTRSLGEDEQEDHGRSIATLNSVCQEYADLVPNSDGQPMRIAVFLNTERSEGRSFCYFSSSGYCLGIISDSIDNRPTTLNHEIGGHGFAWLADEYIEFSNQTYSNPESLIDSYGSWGAYLNIDWRSDPLSVRWSSYLQDSRYDNEGLGVFEGAYRYSYGLFRATSNSMMGSDFKPGVVFNAPSREAIYRNIMRFSSKESWTFDYETFVAIDEAGRKQAAEAYAAYPPNAIRSLSVKDDFKPGLPPMKVDESVREIIVHDDGTFKIVR